MLRQFRARIVSSASSPDFVEKSVNDIEEVRVTDEVTERVLNLRICDAYLDT